MAKRKSKVNLKSRKKVKTNGDSMNQEGKCPICLQDDETVQTLELPEAQPERKTVKDKDLIIDGLEWTESLQFRLNNFSIFDSNNHLVSLSTDRLNSKKLWSDEFFFVGLVSRIDEENNGTGVMTRSTSIVAHYIDQKYFQIILETEVGKTKVEYYLGVPSETYKQLYLGYRRRALLCNIVAKRFEDAFDDDEELEYDDITEYVTSLKKWNEKPIEPFDQEDLQNYSQFIAKHLISMENVEADDDDKFTLTNMPGAKEILRQGGFDSFREKRSKRRVSYEADDELSEEYEEDDEEEEDHDTVKKGKKSFNKTFTTPLVCNLFESMFADQMSFTKGIRDKKRPGDITRRGNAEKKDQEYNLGPLLRKEKSRAFYRSVQLGVHRQELRPESYIRLEKDQLTIYGHVIHLTIYGHVIHIFKDDGMEPHLHIQVIEHECTILGDTVMEKELFKIHHCEMIPLLGVSIVYVEFRPVPDLSSWRKYGCDEIEELESSSHYFWRFYSCNETGKFEYPEHHQIRASCFCDRFPTFYQELIDAKSAEVVNGQLRIAKEVFDVGHFMYLKGTEAHKLLRMDYKVAPPVDLPPVDYRIQTRYQCLKDCPLPFVVIQIKKISDSGLISFIVFYRPENTTLDYEEAIKKNISCVYINRKIRTLDIKKLGGYIMTGRRPVLVTGANENELAEFCEGDSNRFYTIQEFYINKEGDGTYHQLSEEDLGIPNITEIDKEPDNVDEPLRTLDIFAGAGGLSKGLEESGVAICKWAVEYEEAAAEAFKANHKDAKVFCQDTNIVLQKLMEDPHQKDVRGMPERGEVDLIIGGPPCQGYSVLNIYNEKDYSKMKNSQIANYIGYIDYYRPRFLLLENVKQLVAHKGGEVLKLILSSLIRMGYQVEFGILQAGMYGVAQSRRRLIVLAAGPGDKLPDYPEPWHVFPNAKNMSEDIYLCNKQHIWPLRSAFAPRRAITTWDIISDLPEIKSGCSRDVMVYPKRGLDSHRAKLYFRKGAGMKLLDHICKPVSEVNQARIDSVPTLAGSDWRDIPNRKVQLESGKVVQRLNFPYSKKVFNEKTKQYTEMFGVCECFLNGKTCKEGEIQKDTIIPWFLHHTAYRRSGNWAGTYGRIPWGGIFKTTLTSPEPSGSQGQVLHPEQNRICSVREFARSQGFRDSFVFNGNINQKHRQVGNAVPPPLGRAIGEELKKCILRNKIPQTHL